VIPLAGKRQQDPAVPADIVAAVREELLRNADGATSDGARRCFREEIAC